MNDVSIIDKPYKPSDWPERFNSYRLSVVYLWGRFQYRATASNGDFAIDHEFDDLNKNIIESRMLEVLTAGVDRWIKSPNGGGRKQ